MIAEAVARMREAVTAPMSGRVPLPRDRREAETEAGEFPQAWTLNLNALRLATVTREPQPMPSTTGLRIVERTNAG